MSDKPLSEYTEAELIAATIATSITKDERDLLFWLSAEDFSQYGECHGKVLDSLCSLGLAQVHGEETEHNNTFIAKGRGIMFRAVSLTPAGWDLKEKLSCPTSNPHTPSP
jgi:hypothetical protein